MNQNECGSEEFPSDHLFANLEYVISYHWQKIPSYYYAVIENGIL
jgi:hypothetical protein